MDRRNHILEDAVPISGQGPNKNCVSQLVGFGMGGRLPFTAHTGIRRSRDVKWRKRRVGVTERRQPRRLMPAGTFRPLGDGSLLGLWLLGVVIIKKITTGNG